MRKPCDRHKTAQHDDALAAIPISAGAANPHGFLPAPLKCDIQNGPNEKEERTTIRDVLMCTVK